MVAKTLLSHGCGQDKSSVKDWFPAFQCQSWMPGTGEKVTEICLELNNTQATKFWLSPTVVDTGDRWDVNSIVLFLSPVDVNAMVVQGHNFNEDPVSDVRSPQGLQADDQAGIGMSLGLRGTFTARPRR
jgi:hypothetical protein